MICTLYINRVKFDLYSLHKSNRVNCLIVLVDPAVQSLLKRSTILHGNIAHAKQLVEWVEDQRFGWKLCYRASVDGWKGEDFHQKCDDVGQTVTLVKCGTNVFGGYTDQNWKQSTGALNIFFPFLINLRCMQKWKEWDEEG